MYLLIALQIAVDEEPRVANAPVGLRIGEWREALQARALPGRVEDWRAGLGRSLGSLLSRPFVCECPSISTVPRLQSPPRRTQLADCPHYAPPFASCQGLWDLSCRSDFQHVPPHSIAVEQPKSVVQPPPIPSLPAEALSFLSMRQMAPNLLLHPVLDEAEALAGVPNGEVVHPTA